MARPGDRVISLLVLTAASCATPPYSATPQRPTVSSHTTTTAEDTIEIEMGAHYDPDDSFDSPVVVKAGVGPRTEAYIGVSPFRYVRRTGNDGHGPSDTLLGARHRFREEDDKWPSFAIQLEAGLPTGNEGRGLGSGEVDLFGALIASRTSGTWSGTAFAQIGVVDASTSNPDLAWLLALAAGSPIGEGWSLFAELATELRHETDVESVFVTFGTTYTPRPSRVFDAGVVIGLTDDAPSFQIFFGLTTNAGSWRRRDVEPR